MNTKHLGTYLNDHLAGSVAALELFKRLKSANAGTPRGQVFADLLQEIEQDQTALRDILKELDFRVSPIRKAAAWLAEKFVLNLLAEKPGDKLVRFEQLEALALGIEGKRALWLALNALAAQATLFEPVDLMRLVQRAKEQRECVETIRLDAERIAGKEIVTNKTANFLDLEAQLGPGGQNVLLRYNCGCFFVEPDHLTPSIAQISLDGLVSQWHRSPSLFLQPLPLPLSQQKPKR